MSVVTVVKKDGQCAIACDTQSAMGGLITPGEFIEQPSKFFKCNDAFVGLTGWYALQDIFQSVIEHYGDKLNFSSRRDIYETLRFIHPILKEQYYVQPSDGENDQPIETSQLHGLVIHPNGIFSFTGYRSVSEYTQYWAIGSGKEYALGALHALYDSELSAEMLARQSIEASCVFDDGCGLPILSEVVDLAG